MYEKIKFLKLFWNFYFLLPLFVHHLQYLFTMTDLKSVSTPNALTLDAESTGSNAADSSEPLELNVGGQIFTTSRTTLLMYKESFFTGLLSGPLWPCIL